MRHLTRAFVASVLFLVIGGGTAFAGPITNTVDECVTEKTPGQRALAPGEATWSATEHFQFVAFWDHNAGCGATISIPIILHNWLENYDGTGGLKIELLFDEYFPKCGRIQFDAHSYLPGNIRDALGLPVLDPNGLVSLVYNTGVDCTLGPTVDVPGSGSGAGSGSEPNPEFPVFPPTGQVPSPEPPLSPPPVVPPGEPPPGIPPGVLPPGSLPNPLPPTVLPPSVLPPDPVPPGPNPPGPNPPGPNPPGPNPPGPNPPGPNPPGPNPPGPNPPGPQPVPIPEPGTMTLVGLGMAWLARKRMKAKR